MSSSGPSDENKSEAPDQARASAAETTDRDNVARPGGNPAKQPTGTRLHTVRARVSRPANLPQPGAPSSSPALRTPSSPPPNPPNSKRAEKSQARRDAIVAAALDEFTERGFALTRMEDVARRAEVGKGTIYLHFKDKEALFQQLVITMLGPVVAQLKKLPDEDRPVRDVLERLFAMFVEEIYGTKRREILRLVMTEGPRFPHLAEFYYRHVVEPASAALRGLLDRALVRGELRKEQLAKFPLLLIAPGLVAVIWSSLFDRFAPLDMVGLMRAHLDVLLGPEGEP